ncbi:MAG: hypothetical protein MUO80_07020 [Dehalococcoidia bacterium]|nr:hypothetical protein [Dehalococcoidia bacterium]
MKDNKIIESARLAYGQHWRSTSDESTGDKQATKVTEAWQQDAVCNEIECEALIREGLNEKIDLIDHSVNMAYEMKVSGKNPHHEFYRDIFKVIIYNQRHAKKLKGLVFITEQDGADKLNKGLGKAVQELLARHELDITVKGI